MTKFGSSCWAIVPALLAAATSAEAASYNKNITLYDTSPTYTPAGSTTAIPYQALAFSVDATGSYNLNLGSSGGYYPGIALYQPTFVASSPATNLLASSPPGSFFSSGFTATLAAGTTYTLALGGRLFAAAGGSNPPQYLGVLSINGPGSVSEQPVPAAAVPELAAWTMLILGFGLVGGALRRRKISLSFA